MTESKPILPVGTPVRYVGHGSSQWTPCRCQMPVNTVGRISGVNAGYGAVLNHPSACRDLYAVTFDTYGGHMVCESEIEPLD